MKWGFSIAMLVYRRVTGLIHPLGSEKPIGVKRPFFASSSIRLILMARFKAEGSSTNSTWQLLHQLGQRGRFLSMGNPGPPVMMAEIWRENHQLRLLLKLRNFHYFRGNFLHPRAGTRISDLPTWMVGFWWDKLVDTHTICMDLIGKGTLPGLPPPRPRNEALH